MPQATQLELKQIRDETEKLEEKKRLSLAEKERKRKEKEAKKRKKLLSKLVAPVLFILTVLVALVLSHLRR